MSTHRWIAIGVLLAAGAAYFSSPWSPFAASARAGRDFASSARAGRDGPLPVTQVPTALSSGGVYVNNQVVLEPLRAPPSGAMTRSAAIRAARPHANTHHFAAKALEASVTLPGSIPPPGTPSGSWSPISHVPAWVVTFTSPTPVDVSVGNGRANAPSGAALLVTHYSVVLNATTGKFVLGFFTP